MNLYIRWFLICLLTFISASASIFIVIESGTFYQQFYNQHLALFQMGYWAALLNEIFMAIMAATWLPEKHNKNKKSIHPANYLFKFLLFILFLTTVGGASFNSIAPLLEHIQEQNNRSKIITIIETQVKDNNLSFKTFSTQNQKTNTALAARNQIKAKEELKSKVDNFKSTFSLWFQIFFIVLLRLGVQLANLCCVWLVGWLYREKEKKPEQKPVTTSPTGSPFQVLPKEITIQETGWSNIPLSFEKLKHRVLKQPVLSEFNDATDVAIYREKIQCMTEKVFKSTSMHKCCADLEIKVNDLSDILNCNIKLNSSYLPMLRSVYEKLLGFQGQRKAV